MSSCWVSNGYSSRSTGLVKVPLAAVKAKGFDLDDGRAIGVVPVGEDGVQLGHGLVGRERHEIVRRKAAVLDLVVANLGNHEADLDRGRAAQRRVGQRRAVAPLRWIGTLPLPIASTCS